MFRKNTRHQQPALIPYGHDVSAASELPEKQRKRLENSWAGASYKGFFHRIDETVFAVLYSGVGSRPNAVVNVLVRLEALKAGFGWSDQELHEHFCYDLQVRYALGYDRLGGRLFSLHIVHPLAREMKLKDVVFGWIKGETIVKKPSEAQVTDFFKSFKHHWE
jgi:hypothetical protein